MSLAALTGQAGLQGEVNQGWEGATGREYETFTFAAPPHPLVLESGEELGPVTVAYETYGRLSEGGDNAVLVCHALTGDSHVASHPRPGSRQGWWEDLVGPGRPLDTDRLFVICSNVLGGCQGTTGPTSIDPRTGRRYNLRFPVITIRDMVRVQRELVRHLGVKRLLCVLGGSMGGMQALEWAVSYPEMVASAVVIAAPTASFAQSIAFNQVGREAIMLDPRWRGGEYDPADPPAGGLSVARMLGMITYQSEASMEAKFGRRFASGAGAFFRFDGRFEVERYLLHQGEKLVRRFDPNTYLYLSKAMDLFDIARGYPSYEAALRRIRARVLAIGISSDILYPRHHQRSLVEDLKRFGRDARYVELDSPWGHDAFLIEFEKLRGVLAAFVQGSRRRRRRPVRAAPALGSAQAGTGGRGRGLDGTTSRTPGESPFRPLDHLAPFHTRARTTP